MKSKNMIKYLLKPTVLYLEDVEAVGGGVLLEEIKDSYKRMRVFNGTLYMCGEHWSVELIHYKKGRGRITKVIEAGEKKAEAVSRINQIMEDKLMDANCNLFNIRSRRNTNRLKGRFISILAIISTYEAAFAYVAGNDITNMYILLASIAIFISSVFATDKAVRG